MASITIANSISRFGSATEEQDGGSRWVVIKSRHLTPCFRSLNPSLPIPTCFMTLLHTHFQQLKVREGTKISAAILYGQTLNFAILTCRKKEQQQLHPKNKGPAAFLKELRILHSIILKYKLCKYIIQLSLCICETSWLSRIAYRVRLKIYEAEINRQFETKTWSP